MYEDILVPTDGSEFSKRAGNHAIDLTKKYNANLHILSIASFTALDAVVPEVMERLTEASREAVDDLSKKAKNSGIENIETSVQEGQNPSQKILDYINEHNIDLIVMGTHGRTGLDRYLLGSTTEKIIKKSPIPVFIVPKEA